VNAHTPVSIVKSSCMSPAESLTWSEGEIESEKSIMERSWYMWFLVCKEIAGVA
jgi:hypothetical protein